MRDRRAERRLMLEAIIDDPAASHSDRLRADEQLRELERAELAGAVAVDRLSPEEVREELDGLRTMCESARATMDGPEAIEPPTDVEELRDVVGLQQALIDRLEERLGERERALQRWSLQRRLLPAPGVVR